MGLKENKNLIGSQPIKKSLQETKQQPNLHSLQQKQKEEYVPFKKK